MKKLIDLPGVIYTDEIELVEYRCLLVTSVYRTGYRAIWVEALKCAHREAWFAHNKPFGWEIHDIRYGGLKLRFECAKERITDYLNGLVPKIDELEAERLSFNGAPAGKFNKNFVWQRYTSIASVSRFN